MYKTTFAHYQKSKNILVVKNFYNLMKPRVMSLVVFTAFVGLIISNKQIDFLTSALALFFVALYARSFVEAPSPENILQKKSLRTGKKLSKH